MSKRPRHASTDNDDIMVIYNLLGNALTVFEDSAMVLRMIKERTDDKKAEELATILFPLFDVYRDEMLSALPEGVDETRSDSPIIAEKKKVSVSLRAMSKGGGGAVIYTSKQQEINTENGETLFAWMDEKGELHGLGIQRHHQIKAERKLTEWLKARYGRKGTLFICSGSGMGGFSDEIAFLLRDNFKLTNFPDLVGDEAYIANATFSINGDKMSCEGTEEISSKSVLSKEVVVRI